MTKQEALSLIDTYKNQLIDPIEMLQWLRLRVIINQLSEEAWNACEKDAFVIMSK